MQFCPFFVSKPICRLDFGEFVLEGPGGHAHFLCMEFLVQIQFFDHGGNGGPPLDFCRLPLDWMVWQWILASWTILAMREP
jgi:hypothetical protein